MLSPAPRARCPTAQALDRVTLLAGPSERSGHAFGRIHGDVARVGVTRACAAPAGEHPLDTADHAIDCLEGDNGAAGVRVRAITAAVDARGHTGHRTGAMPRHR